MNLIAIKDAHKVYQLGEVPVTALDGVTLEIAKGEFAAIWGPSGSGKTTLLNLLCLIDQPTSGSVWVHGQDVSSLSDARRSALRNEVVGIVFQSYNLVPVLSALENVMLPLQIRGVSDNIARERALALLNEVELGRFVQHRPDKMSGGQRQRVAIARALVGEPNLVLADEPTANLDSKTGDLIIELMRNLNETRGVTFVFSTHDRRLIERVKRRIFLQDGRLTEPQA
jgi:putative ABC transport system ATP-binding protein